MPPKGGAASGGGGKKSKKAASGPSNADFFKTEDVLQAVLLADSFQTKFRPLTQQKPKVRRRQQGSEAPRARGGAGICGSIAGATHRIASHDHPSHVLSFPFLLSTPRFSFLS